MHAYAGTAGAFFYPIWGFKPQWSKYREASYGFVRAWVDPEKITFKFVRLNGTIADEFTVKNKMMN